MVKPLFFKTQNTIMSAAAVLAFMYGVSAVLGLVRARLLAHFFGASETLGVFYTADKIPNFVYTILVVGTLSTVFIPVFTHLYKTDEKKAWRTASALISMSVFIFLLLGLVIFIFAKQAVAILSLYRFSTQQIELGASLMRIMIVAQLILVVSSFLTSILHSFKYFLVPALAPVLYNVGMILGIVFLAPTYGIYGPAVGVLLGALFHLIVQIPLVGRTGFNFSFGFDLEDSGLREVLKLLPPRIISTAVAQSFSIVNNSLAIIISTSSVVMLRFAEQLQTFPVFFFGASIALAALPTLSGESGDADRDKFRKTLLTSLYQMFFLIAPLSVILLVLRVSAVRLVYGAANFPWSATVTTAQALGFYSISIFAQAGILLLSRAFYALRDTLTPVVAGLSGLVVGVSMAYVLVKFFGLGVWAIALSFSISSFVDMLLLFVMLFRKIGGFEMKQLIPILKISMSGVFMGLSLYIPMKLLDIYVLDTTKTVYLLVLVAAVTAAGLFSYLFFTKVFRVEEVVLLYRLLGKLQIKKVSSQVLEGSID